MGDLLTDLRFGQTMLDAADEIEQLRTDRDWWAEIAKEYKDDYNEVIRTGRCASGYHITPKMIDAAVEYANDESVALQGRQGCAWDALNKLNIFRCEKCDQGRIFSTPQVGLPLVCPDCNGHSYVIVPDDGSSEPGSDVGVINDV